MCPTRDWFQDMKEATGTVLLGNNQTCCIKGIGSIMLRLSDGSVKMLSNVRYIPEVKRNLISLGTLEQRGYSFVSKNGEMQIIKGSQIKMTARRNGSLYYLQAAVIDGESNSVATPDMKLWHQRLGHPSMGSLKALVNLGLIEAGGEEVMQACEDCLLGKSKKQSYPAGKHTSTSLLDYIHSDLWGPAPTKTLGGGRFYMTIIDDWSRKVWVYVLKEKSDAFKTFRTWCAEVKNEKGTAPKILRTDNGLEYLSKEFDLFCQENGIRRHKTVPANPQQNGVAERIVADNIRWMLVHGNI